MGKNHDSVAVVGNAQVTVNFIAIDRNANKT